MAPLNPFPLNTRDKYVINSAVHGLFGELGTGYPDSPGSWLLYWLPDASWDGSMAVMGRIGGESAHTDGVPMVQVPYVALYLNSAVPGAPYSYATDLIVSTSVFEIRNNALSAGLLFNVNGGFGSLYIRSSGAATIL